MLFKLDGVLVIKGTCGQMGDSWKMSNTMQYLQTRQNFFIASTAVKCREFSLEACNAFASPIFYFQNLLLNLSYFVNKCSWACD